MAKSITVLFIVLFFPSCMPKIPESMKKELKTCYDPKKNTGISSMLNVNGYYRSRHIWDAKKNSVVVHHFMFFEDGIFWSSIFDYEEGGNRIDIDEFFDKLLANPNGLESERQRGTGYQGLYTISGDTIKAQYFNNPAPPNQYVLGYDAFKIIDKNTVQEISPGPYEKAEPAVFVPIKGPLKSDSWIQREPWIYCDPADAPRKGLK